MNGRGVAAAGQSGINTRAPMALIVASRISAEPEREDRLRLDRAFDDELHDLADRSPAWRLWNAFQGDEPISSYRTDRQAASVPEN